MDKYLILKIEKKVETNGDDVAPFAWGPPEARS